VKLADVRKKFARETVSVRRFWTSTREELVAIATEAESASTVNLATELVPDPTPTLDRLIALFEKIKSHGEDSDLADDAIAALDSLANL